MNELCDWYRNFFEQTQILKDITRIACSISSNRKKDVDVTLVTVAKRVSDDIIVERIIEHITFKTSKTSAHNISIEGFVSSPVESIL